MWSDIFFLSAGHSNGDPAVGWTEIGTRTYAAPGYDYAFLD
jgi:hypothetical protein